MNTHFLRRHPSHRAGRLVLYLSVAVSLIILL